MLSKFLNVLLVLIILGFAGYYFYKIPKFNDGEMAPNFTTELLNGEAFELSNLRENYVLIDFWGSWCGPCRRENPALVELYNKFHGQKFTDAVGFEIVSIAVERNERSMLRAIEQDGLRWPFHIPQLERFASPIASQYGVKEIPTKYLVGPKGQILSVNANPAELDAFLQSKLK